MECWIPIRRKMTPLTIVMASTLVLALFLFSARTSWADTSDIETVEVSPTPVKAKASSTLVEKGNLATTYEADNAFDSLEETAWCEGKKGSGIGEWIEASFPKVYANVIVVQHGVFASENLYRANNRIKTCTLSVTYDNGSVQQYNGKFEDVCEVERPGGPCITNKGSIVKMPGEGHRVEIEGGCVTKIRLTINSVYPGDKYDDTCVTGLQLFHSFTHYTVMDKTNQIRKLDLEKTTARASSNLTEKGRDPSSYVVQKAFDDNLATAWCEGKPGGGEGEWIEASFEPTIAWGVWVMNGLAANPSTYQNNNRVQGYTLIVTTKGGGRIEKKGTFRDRCNSLRQLKCEDCRKRSCDCKEDCAPAVDDPCSYFYNLFDKETWGDTKYTFPKDDRTIDFDFKPLCMTGIKLKIDSVYKGEKFDDTCISEMKLVEIGPTLLHHNGEEEFFEVPKALLDTCH